MWGAATESKKDTHHYIDFWFDAQVCQQQPSLAPLPNPQPAHMTDRDEINGPDKSTTSFQSLLLFSCSTYSPLRIFV